MPRRPVSRTPKPRQMAPVRVKRSQIHLPAGFHKGGSRAATLREVSSPKVDTRQGHALSTAEQIALTVRRFAAQPKVALASLGVGRIGKARAIQEIKRQTRLGKALVEIELRTIEVLAQEMGRRQRAAFRKRRTAKRSRGK